MPANDSDRLLLFDIDGTLLDAAGAGLSALTDATREIFEDDGPPLDLAGATDWGLFRATCKTFGRADEEDLRAKFYDAYLARLEQALNSPCFNVTLLPGARKLIEELSNLPDVHLGILSGNIAAGSETKLAYFDLDHHFSFGAYGDDHYDRNQLGPIALRRAKEETGIKFTTSNIIIIGDTPKDINCAKALGCSCLAVATGHFSNKELEEAGANQVAADLSETETILSLLLGEAAELL